LDLSKLMIVSCGSTPEPTVSRSSQDADFAEMASLLGPTPRVIWLRCGNQPTSVVEHILRLHAEAVAAFERDEDAASLELYESHLQ
jgi:predicted nuclease of predicted toxin-antitoxin system